MAYRQTYRGSPELKQYYLVNDFSGGLDTVALDEKMADNTLRETYNLDLAVQGAITNRKGFGELANFNQLLIDKSVILPTARSNFFKIIKNEGDVLVKAHNYAEYANYLAAMEANIYELKILMNYTVGSLVKFNLLTVSNSTGLSTGLTVTLEEKFSVIGTLVDTYNPNTTQYVQKIYFMTSDVYKTTDENKLGIGVFNLDDDTLTIINKNNAYEPTPYEAVDEELGFNVLRASPLTDITTQGFGDSTILGAYYTNVDGASIKYIPTNGNFDINVFQLGETMTPQHIKLTLQDQNGDDISYNLVSQVDTGGLFVYSIRNAVLAGVTSISIVLAYIEAKDALAFYWDSAHTYTGTELVIGGTYDVDNALNVLPTTSILRPEFFLTKLKTVPSTYDYTLELLETQVPLNSVQDLYHYIAAGVSGGDIGQAYSSGDLPTSVLRVDEFYGYTYYQITNTGQPRVFLSTTVNGTKQVVLLNNSSVGLEIGDILNSNTDYFVYLRNYDTGSRYFLDIVEPTYFNDFTTRVYIKDGTAILTEAINLDGAHMQQIQERLVIYKGNTIYFSEFAQFNYIPSSNFIILALDVNDEITRIYYFRGVYIIFTKESIYRLSGTLSTDADSTLAVTKVNEAIGCIAPNSVRSVNNNLLFLSQQGLYKLTQNYYQEGLENVKKVDDAISNIMVKDSDAYSIMYKDQYWLISENNDFSTIKYYFNLDKVGGEHPYVLDKYTVSPDNLELLDNVIYSIKNGSLYRYDKGYTDFLPRDAISSDLEDYLYTYRFKTKNEDLGYPTHDKKMKSIFFKVRSSTIAQLGISIYVNEQLVLSPSSFKTTINDLGELVYEEVYEANLVTRPVAPLGDYHVSVDTLGDSEVDTHKLVIGRKGKNFSIVIEQKTNGAFNLEDIGYLYKLGKVKESR